MQSRRTAITQTAERPVRRRRGGSAVQIAISDAVIAELAEVGFGRLTFEGVAERAGTGKSPLYRRWPDTTSLVIDTLEKLGSDPTKYVRTGLLRDDLIGLTVHMIKTQKGVKGDAYRSLLGEAHRYPQLLARFKTQVLAPRFEALTELLRDAAKRGEISPERLTPMVLEVLHALILKHTLLEARDPTKKDITEMIDEVLLPLLVAKPIQQELRTSAAPGRGQDFGAPSPLNCNPGHMSSLSANGREPLAYPRSHADGLISVSQFGRVLDQTRPPKVSSPHRLGSSQ
jgi:AcrR family transcriptional regulator